MASKAKPSVEQVASIGEENEKIEIRKNIEEAKYVLFEQKLKGH